MVQNDTQFDIAVLGGGPSGFSAAVAAGRMGAQVVLFEQDPQLGGMGTSALVNNFCPAHWDGERFIIGGFFAELRDGLIKRGALYANRHTEPYDPDIYAEEALNHCLKAGVDVRLNTRVSKTQPTPDGSTQVTTAGGKSILARYVVDASGDAGPAAAAGIPFDMAQGRRIMPLTYCYCLGPVDVETLKRELPECARFDEHTGQHYVFIGGHPTVNEWVRQARENGTLSIPRNHVSVAQSIPGQPHLVTVNFGRVPVQNPLDENETERASEIGRKQVDEGIAFFRQYVPGFEQAQLVRLAQRIGVRESRRLRGLYSLSKEDVLGTRQFEDVIAQCCYPIDIHEPESDQTTMFDLAPGTHYDIPWRCLIPEAGPEKWIIAGRCISASREAMSSLRVSPSIIAIGEAAGITAALAAETSCVIRDVPFLRVQQRLLATGAILS